MRCELHIVKTTFITVYSYKFINNSTKLRILLMHCNTHILPHVSTRALLCCLTSTRALAISVDLSSSSEDTTTATPSSNNTDQTPLFTMMTSCRLTVVTDCETRVRTTFLYVTVTGLRESGQMNDPSNETEWRTAAQRFFCFYFINQ